MDGPTQRALAAYYSAAHPDGPPLGAALFTADNGKRYVILRNVDRVQAVYRVRPDGDIERLRQWPPELNVLPPDQ